MCWDEIKVMHAPNEHIPIQLISTHIRLHIHRYVFGAGGLQMHRPCHDLVASVIAGELRGGWSRDQLLVSQHGGAHGVAAGQSLQQHSRERYNTHLLPMMSSTLAFSSSVILSRYCKLCRLPLSCDACAVNKDDLQVAGADLTVRAPGVLAHTVCPAWRKIPHMMSTLQISPSDELQLAGAVCALAEPAAPELRPG